VAFQTKNFASIVAAMVNHMRGTQTEVTDFNIGAVGRTLVEAPAVEIDELYQQMFIGLKEAIPVAIYNSFSFDLMSPVAASGNVRVTITSSAQDTSIAAGTIFKVQNGKTDYASAEDVTILAGNTFADVLVTARNAGTVGNIPANQSFTLSPTLSNLVSATNLVAFSNGLNQETEDARKERFARYIRSLSRGTVAAIEFALETVELEDVDGLVIERVQARSVVEPYLLDPLNPIALVECYLHNGTAPASTDLIDRAVEVIHGYTDGNGNKIPGWKAAGVKVDIFPATELTVDVTGVITPLPGYDAADLAPLAIEQVGAYLQGIDMSTTGSAAIRSEIVAIVMGIQGTYNFDLTVPAADVQASYSQKIMPGTIDIT